MRYDPYTQRVWVHSQGVNGRCLNTDRHTCLLVGMQPCARCSGPAVEHHGRPANSPRFVPTLPHGIRHQPGDGLLRHLDAPERHQFWAFHPQQYDLETYSFCSNEYGQCAFSGTKSVRYGANGTYVYRVLTNGTPCDNTTFGDPIPGVLKQCAIGPAGFNYCAGQGSQCSFTGTKVVAYGARNSFYYKPFTNGVTCDVGPFGGDPLVNVGKACYVANGQ